MKKQAYIWSSEISKERMTLIEIISSNYEALFNSPGGRGHYTRFHWAGLSGHRSQSAKFKGIVDGREMNIHLYAIPLIEYYAREVFIKSLERTRERYPDFDSHTVENGTRTGERILNFTSKTNTLAASHLYTSFRLVVEEEVLLVNECILIEAANSWGESASIAKWNNGREEMHPDYCVIRVIIDTETITNDLIEEIKVCFENGNTWEYSSISKSYAFKDIKAGFVELVNPELILLNWDETQPIRGEVEDQLFYACETLNIGSIKQALIKGANPNVFDLDTTPLSIFIDAASKHEFAINTPDPSYMKADYPSKILSQAEKANIVDAFIAAGYHPDVHAPNNTPAITEASLNNQPSILERLLEHGADPSIQPFSDSSFDEWSLTWDSPWYEWKYEDEEYGRELITLLMRYFPTPFYRVEHELETLEEVRDLLDIAEYERLHEIYKNNIIIDEPQELPDEDELWISNNSNDSLARLAVAFARMYNTLDASWMRGRININATYESQSVFETLSGAGRIQGYWGKKLNTIKASGQRAKVIAELGFEPQTTKHCVILYQAESKEHDDSISRPKAYVAFTTDKFAKMMSAVMVTCAPHPSLARGLKYFPGACNMPPSYTKCSED